MKNRWLVTAVVLLLVLQVALIFVSWFLSATMVPHVRPLLSAEAIRWFCANVTRHLGSPPLVWLLLGAMSWGCLSRSQLLHARSALAVKMALSAALLCLAIVLLLTCVPGAILLSAMGHLWPSPFTDALVPISAAIIVLVSTVYGFFAHTFTSLSDVIHSVCTGIEKSAPLLLLCVQVVELYESWRFAFLEIS